MTRTGPHPNGAPAPMPHWDPPARTFWLLFGAGVLLRIVLVASSIGTNDVVFKTFWAGLIEEHGVIGAYSLQDVINERGIKIALFPPLTLFIFKLMIIVSNVTGIAYTDVFRLVQSGADIVTMYGLVVIARRILPAQSRAIGLFFFLCPAALFISAFHCNTDSTMVAFIVASIAVLPATRWGPLAAGVLLAAATGIKILPLFLVPFYFVALIPRRQAIRFAAGWTVSIVTIYAPTAILGGGDVIHRILSYAGYLSDWGISGTLLSIRYVLGVSESPRWVELAMLYHEYGKYAVIAVQGAFLLWFSLRVLRVRTADPQHAVLAASAVVFLLALFWAPGFGVQYLVWPIAFLPFVLRWRDSLLIATAYSVLLFATYTTWSGGFPWWYADSTTAQKTNLLVVLGFLSWILTGYGVLMAVLRTASLVETERGENSN